MDKKPIITITVEPDSSIDLKRAFVKAYRLAQEGVELHDKQYEGFHIYFTQSYPIPTPDRVEWVDGQLCEIFKSRMKVYGKK